MEVPGAAILVAVGADEAGAGACCWEAAVVGGGGTELVDSGVGTSMEATNSWRVVTKHLTETSSAKTFSTRGPVTRQFWQ